MTDTELKKYEQHLQDWIDQANKTYPWEPEWVMPNWHQNYEGKKFKEWMGLSKQRAASSDAVNRLDKGLQ